MSAKRERIVFVTGLSGAGMSSALKALEDIGYEVFDNFPLRLIDPFLKDDPDGGHPVAIGIDTRTRGFDPQGVLEMVRRIGARLVFMTCDEGELQKRFTQTRRTHPLAKDRPVPDGIKKEQALLYSLRDEADPIVDTTRLSIHDLRRVIQGHFSLSDEPGLSVTILSFGFKHGIPREADMMMDVRFLRNPHWDDTLRPLTGRDPAVQDYIAQDESFDGFVSNFKTLIAPLLPRYSAEGKSYLTIAIGCTGGRHRSVYTAELLGRWIEELGYAAGTIHRDVER